MATARLSHVRVAPRKMRPFAAMVTGKNVDVALEARAATIEVAGQAVELLTYNGGFPGPLLRARDSAA